MCALSSLVFAFGAVGAQLPANEELRGIVLIGEEPLTEGTVVLHRVSPDSSGTIDSTTVSRDGSFSLPLPTVPDPGGRNDIYFASMRFEGVLYFGPAISEAVQLDSVYVIQVHHSEVAPPGGVSFTMAVRNLFLEPGPENTWRATDVLQLRNDRDRTLIAAEGGVVWSYALPPVASEIQLGQGSDLPPDAVEFLGHIVRLTAPIPPGERLLMVRYSLPSPPFAVPVPGLTETMEVLVREPGPPLEVRGLDEVDVISLEPGSNFRRYGRANLLDATVQLEAGTPAREIPMQGLAVLLALLLGGVGVYAFRRPVPATTYAAADLAHDPRETLLLEIARLDERIARGDLSSEDRSNLAHKRTSLLDRLKSSG